MLSAFINKQLAEKRAFKKGFGCLGAMDKKHVEEKFVGFLNKCCEWGSKAYEIGSKPIVIPEDSQAHKVLSNYLENKEKNRIVELTSQETLNRFTIVGRVQHGSKTRLAINGSDFAITDETWVIGVLAAGTIAKVEGVIVPGVGRIARKVKVVDRALEA